MSKRAKSQKRSETVPQTESSSETDDSYEDTSNLRKPVSTSIFGLENVVNLFSTATEEVKKYLSNECEILYECRICKSLFRSLANFIIHKRCFCKENFSMKLVHCSCYHNEIYEKSESKAPNKTNLQMNKRKNLAKILQKLINQKNNESIKAVEEETSDTNKGVKIVLEDVPGNKSSKFQNIINSDNDVSDSMKSQVMELHNIFTKDEAILDSNGKIIQKNNITNELVCKICNQIFSTNKTFSYHMKNKHRDDYLTYPCSECDKHFVTSWGMIRHLINVHKKSTTYVKKIRNQIHNSCIKRSDVEKVKDNQRVTETNNINEEEEWVTNLEDDRDFQMCAGCGTRFERKAALIAHSQMCSKRKEMCIGKTKENKNVQMEKPNSVVQKEGRKASGNVTSNASQLTNAKITKEKTTLKKIEEIIGLPLSSKITISKSLSEQNINSVETIKDKVETFNEEQNNNNKQINIDLPQSICDPSTINMEETRNFECTKNYMFEPSTSSGTIKIRQSLSYNYGKDEQISQSMDHTYALNIENKDQITSEFIIKDEDDSNLLENSLIYDGIANLEEKNEFPNLCDNENNYDTQNVEKPLSTCQNLGENVNIIYDNVLKSELETAFIDMLKTSLKCPSCQVQLTDVSKLLEHLSTHSVLHYFQCIKCHFISCDKNSGIEHALLRHTDSVSENVIFPIPQWKIQDLLNNSYIMCSNELLSNFDREEHAPNEVQVTGDNNSSENSLEDTKNRIRKFIYNVILGTEENSTVITNVNKTSPSSRPTRARNKCVNSDFVYHPVIKTKRVKNVKKRLITLYTKPDKKDFNFFTNKRKKLDDSD